MKAIIIILLAQSTLQFSFDEVKNFRCKAISHERYSKELIPMLLDNMRVAASGGFGKIYVPIKDGKFAIKYMKVDDKDAAKYVKEEIDALYEVQGAPRLNNLPGALECYFFKREVFVALEVFKGDMEKFITTSTNPLIKSLVWRIYASISILNAVLDLHKLNYLHNDIKLKNVLVRNEIEFVLGDFGLASKAENPDDPISQLFMNTLTLQGTPGFMPPEITKHRYKVYSAKSDVYAAGLSIFALLTGADPQRLSQVLAAEESIKRYFINNSNSSNIQLVNVFFKETLLKMVRTNSLSRYSVANALEEFTKNTKDFLEYLVTGKTTKQINLPSPSPVHLNDVSKLAHQIIKTVKQQWCKNKTTGEKCMSNDEMQQILVDNQLFFNYLQRSDAIYIDKEVRLMLGIQEQDKKEKSENIHLEIPDNMATQKLQMDIEPQMTITEKIYSLFKSMLDSITCKRKHRRMSVYI